MSRALEVEVGCRVWPPWPLRTNLPKAERGDGGVMERAGCAKKPHESQVLANCLLLNNLREIAGFKADAFGESLS